MKKGITLFIAGVIMVTSLSACTSWVHMSEVSGTDEPQTNMPNPASVYCEQNGNKLEIHTASDGNQSGICVFPNGSTCDEWAYFRGECDTNAQTSPTPAVTVETTTEASDGTAENGSGGYMAPGTSEAISNWWGVIRSTEPGAQYDDYFERQDLGQIIYFGIDSMEPTVKTQIEALCDSGKVVHLYGTVFSNVPDYNGSQVQVDRIEIEE